MKPIVKWVGCFLKVWESTVLLGFEMAYLIWALG